MQTSSPTWAFGAQGRWCLRSPAQPPAPRALSRDARADAASPAKAGEGARGSADGRCPGAAPSFSLEGHSQR